jgi:hypothetical protein
LEALDYVVPDGGAPLPVYNFGPKTLICKSFGGVQKSVLGELKMHKVAIGARGGRGDFIGMVDRCQSSKPRFYVSLTCRVWDTKVLVEIARSSDVPVCFVDGIKEVGAYD